MWPELLGRNSLISLLLLETDIYAQVSTTWTVEEERRSRLNEFVYDKALWKSSKFFLIDKCSKWIELNDLICSLKLEKGTDAMLHYFTTPIDRDNIHFSWHANFQHGEIDFHALTVKHLSSIVNFHRIVGGNLPTKLWRLR